MLEVSSAERLTAVVRGAELRDRDGFGGFEDALAHLLRRLDVRIDRRDHATKTRCSGCRYLRMIFRTWVRSFSPARASRRCHLQLEEAGEQIGVVDFRAVRRITVAARAGVHADARALFGGEARESEVVSASTKLLSSRRRVDLHGQPSSGSRSAPYAALGADSAGLILLCSRSRSS